MPEKSSKERVINQITADQKMINRLGSDSNLNRMLAWLSGTIVEPIKSFFKKNSTKVALGILGFIFLFKIGEAFLGRIFIMNLDFLKQILLYTPKE